jgi:NAD(P)-dependent dehydrogenase (short-subunit alcohol dehydrogenase family)
MEETREAMGQIPQTFAGHTVLVTGGTKGIGKAAAIRFAALGAWVTATYGSDDETAARFGDELGESHRIVKCDLSDYAGLRNLVSQHERDGRLPDIVVANAAFQKKATVAETSVELMESTFRANVFGNFVLIRSVCDRLVSLKKPGVVIVNSSNQSRFVNPTGFAYSLTKASLNHMVRHLALAYVQDGIRVNGIILGWFDTEGERAFYSEEHIRKQAAVTIPMGRAGSPEEAAKMITFLASQDASYATGSLVRLDGGFALAPDLST